MNMPADTLRALLINGSVEWDIYIDERPAEAKNVLTIYNTGGTEPTMLMGEKNKDIYHPTCLIQGVGLSKAETYSKLDEVRQILNRASSFSEGDAIYCGIFVSSEINYIGKLDDDQCMYNINFRIIRQEDDS